MKKTLIISLMVLLFIPSLAFAQTSRSKDITEANRSWPGFIVLFRAAVNQRDRAALRGMIATPFNAQDCECNSPDKVIKWLDKMKLWGELQREVAPKSKSKQQNNGARPQRVTGIFWFEFGRDGRWRLSAQGENEVR